MSTQTPCETDTDVPNFPPADRSKPILQSKNILSVTVKLIEESSNATLHRGRLVINKSEVYTVRLCGILTNITNGDDYTDLTFYDGTGAIKGRITLHRYYIVQGTPRMVENMTLIEVESARIVTNHNDITHHMLATIYEALDLEAMIKARPPPPAPTPEDTEAKAQMAAILALLSNDEHRDSEAGASFSTILKTFSLDEETGRKLLSAMVEEAKIYQTIDYYHFKSCTD
ncbi:unnamed protein product [Urochloa humidicola]